MEFNGKEKKTDSKDGKIEGVGTFSGGVYGDLKIDGVCTINGDLEADSLNVDGVCTCNGNITAKKFDCDGVITIAGNLRSGTIDIDGVVKLGGSKVEADRIDCDGVLSINGEISADIIIADGKLNAEEILGDHITIKSYWRRGIRGMFLKGGEKIGGKFSIIGLIEGTTVELRGVRAKSVSGQNVYIGKYCEIDKASASGELYIHPTSKVGEVVS